MRLGREKKRLIREAFAWAMSLLVQNTKNQKNSAKIPKTKAP
jgi:hypothetical protein